MKELEFSMMENLWGGGPNMQCEAIGSSAYILASVAFNFNYDIARSLGTIAMDSCLY